METEVTGGYSCLDVDRETVFFFQYNPASPGVRWLVNKAGSVVRWIAEAGTTTEDDEIGKPDLSVRFTLPRISEVKHQC